MSLSILVFMQNTVVSTNTGYESAQAAKARANYKTKFPYHALTTMII